MAFLAIQCPSCASTDVTLRGGGNYECNHCSTSFVRKQQPQAPPPAPPPPPRPLNAPVNSYGPQVHVHTIAPVQAAAPRRMGCMYVVIMLVSFGVPLIGVGASLWQSRQATQASQNAAAEAVARVTGATNKPEAPTQVVPRTSRSALTAPTVEPDEPTIDPAGSQAKAAGEGTSLDTFQKLKGCSCRAKAGPVELHLRASSGGTSITSSGTRHTMQLAFAAKAGSGTPFTLPTTSKTAPANEYTRGRFPLGMGCDGDTLVIATERSVTGWSISNRTAEWTQTLPASYGDVRPSDTPSLDCKSLSVSGGAVSVRAGGKNVRLDLESGEPASSKGSSKSSSGSSKPSPAPTQPDAEPTPAKPKPADTKPKPADTKPKPPKPEPAPATDTKKKKKKKGKKKKKKGKKKK